jgi:hypothetical protein
LQFCLQAPSQITLAFSDSGTAKSTCAASHETNPDTISPAKQENLLKTGLTTKQSVTQ